jgi:hypothetical protein
MSIQDNATEQRQCADRKHEHSLAETAGLEGPYHSDNATPQDQYTQEERNGESAQTGCQHGKDPEDDSDDTVHSHVRPASVERICDLGHMSPFHRSWMSP